jgi:hypothetical protein
VIAALVGAIDAKGLGSLKHAVSKSINNDLKHQMHTIKSAIDLKIEDAQDVLEITQDVFDQLNENSEEIIDKIEDAIEESFSHNQRSKVDT